MLWFLIAAIVVLIAVVLIKTVSVKPTEAMNATVEIDNNSDRSKQYGENLSRLVKKETISYRGQTDKT